MDSPFTLEVKTPKRSGNCFTHHSLSTQVINMKRQINIPPEAHPVILPCHSIAKATRKVREGVCPGSTPQKSNPNMLISEPLARNLNGGLPLHFTATPQSFDVVGEGKVWSLHHLTSSVTMKSCPSKNDAESGWH